MKSRKGITALKQIQIVAHRAEGKRLGRLQDAMKQRDMLRVAQMWAHSKLEPKILTQDQRMAIHMLVDFQHNFTDRYIYTRLGINPQTFFRWKNDPIFIRELDKEITKRRNFIRVHAFRNVNRAIMRGDMKATWNYLKMSGDLKERGDESRDRTGETELDDIQLEQKIAELQLQLAGGPDPSMS